MAVKTCKRPGCRKRPKSDRAQYCSDLDCERARARARRRDSDNKSRAPEPDGDELDRPAGGVFAATLTALTNAGRVDTPAGQNALALAIRIDHGAADSGSSIASLSRAHLDALDQALKNLAAVDDPVDELEKRRRDRSANG